jgi:hypothetical protein
MPLAFTARNSTTARSRRIWPWPTTCSVLGPEKVLE